MNTLKIVLFGLISITILASCGKDDEPLKEGIDITLRNTLQDPGQTEGTYPGLFGLADDAYDEFASLSFSSVEFTSALGQTGTPFGDINGLYEIDFSENSIEFTLIPDATDPFWPMQFGSFPAGKFDRYYFTLSEAHNISSSSSSDDNVRLRLDSDKVIVVEISEGYDFNPGQRFTIEFE